MKMDATEIEVNGVTYVPKGAEVSKAESVDGLECVIVRTYSAGVFMGYLKSLEGKKAVVLNARRLWYWSGAASLSQLAVDGVSNPDSCKFPCEVPTVTLTEAIEVLPVSAKAKASIDAVKIWTK